MINSFKNPAIMRILRTTERHGAGWREQNFIPDDEAPRQVKFEKNQCLCGFREFPNRIDLPLYTKFTPIGAKNGAETKKSHNFEFHTAPEKLHLLRSFFHFS